MSHASFPSYPVFTVLPCVYCLSLSNALDLDVSSAVLGKLHTNEHRYPADEFRGRFRRPERDKGI